MGQARDEAGNIWETDPQGNPVRLISHQGSPLADPRLPAQVTKATNEATASQYMPQTAQSDAQIKVAEAANAVPVANAQRDKAVADARAAEFNAQAAANGGPKLDATQRAKAIQQFNYAKQLNDVVDHLNQLYLRGPGATSGIEGLKDWLPGQPNNTNFDTAANAARGIVGQALNFTGGQLNTEREAAKAIGPYLPQSSDFDSTILQKIQALQEMAKNGQDNAVQTLGGVPDANGNVHPTGPAQPQATAPSTPDQMGFATGKSRDVVDPVMRATGQKVGAMIAAGAPDAQILGFLQQSGVNPGDTSIQQALQYRKTDDFKKWQRANPGKAYPIGPNFYTRPVPMTDSRALLNKAAAGDMTGAAVAAPVAAANAISGGYLNNLTANPEAAQTGMDLLRGQHPVSSFVGDVAGQATLEGLAGLVPGAQGLMATRYGRRGADAAYGAYSGSGESDDGRGVGAVEGALGGSLFGMAGRGIQKGLGHAATGIQNANLSYLNNLDIPMSVGRIARGANNDFGKAVGGIEDRLAGLPGMDAVIGDVRQQGDRAFNAAAFRQMPGHSGATGAPGVQEGQRLVNQAYGFLDHARIPTDPVFDGEMQALRSNLPKNMGGGIEDRLNTIQNAVNSGELTGRAWQDAVRGIRADRASLKGQPFSDHAMQSLDSAETSLMGLVSRQGPQGAAQKLAAANHLNAQFQTLTSALDNGPAQKAGELFGAGRLDDAARAGARKFGGRTASISGNRPFYDLTTAGKEVMPNLTPDSGTAGRLAVLRGMGTASAALGGAIGGFAGDNSLEGAGEGGGIGGIGGLALAGLLMSPYSKTGQKALQKALLAERPAAMKRLGNYLINSNPKYAGMFGSSLGRDYFFQPELSGQ